MLFVFIKNVLLLQCLYWETHLPRGSHFETGNDVRADELLAAFRREGAAMTKRENVHRMADANKAFAHFAW